jgi:Glycosyltransferase family 28 N-terminal domain
MRVLFSAHGAFGHVLPMIGLASALQDAGHEVRFATGEPLCAAVSSLGLKAIPAGMSDDTLVAEARGRWPETEHQPPGRWAPRMFTEIAAPSMLGDLERIIDSFRPDLVVREEGEHAARPPPPEPGSHG